MKTNLLGQNCQSFQSEIALHEGGSCREDRYEPTKELHCDTVQNSFGVQTDKCDLMNEFLEKDYSTYNAQTYSCRLKLKCGVERPARGRYLTLIVQRPMHMIPS